VWPGRPRPRNPHREFRVHRRLPEATNRCQAFRMAVVTSKFGRNHTHAQNNSANNANGHLHHGIARLQKCKILCRTYRKIIRLPASPISVASFHDQLVSNEVLMDVADITNRLLSRAFGYFQFDISKPPVWGRGRRFVLACEDPRFGSVQRCSRQR